MSKSYYIEREKVTVEQALYISIAENRDLLSLPIAVRRSLSRSKKRERRKYVQSSMFTNK